MSSDATPPLTALQHQLGTAAEQVLRAAGLEPVREELVHLAPVLSSEPQRSLRLRAPDVEVWLHDDGCGFQAGAQSWCVELLDYPTEAAMVYSLEHALTAALARIAR